VADNTELASGSGGDTIATDDIGGVKYPRSKIVIGADGTNDGDVSSSNPLPAKVTGAAAENAAVSGNPVLVGGRYDATPRTLGDGDVGAPAMDADGALHISDGGNTITVDGTVNAVVTNAGTFAVQAAQSGTWTVDLGATDNAVLDAIAASLAGTLTVGSHAVTNAGTFAVQVNGDALTALQLIDDAIYVDDADWTATSSKHTLIGGVYQATPGTITDGDTGPFRVNANGALHVSIQEGGGAGGTSSTDDGAFTAGSGAGTPIMGFFSADTVDAGDVGVLAMDASRRLLVSIEADNVGIGGGTQYTEDAAAPANPVGNALMAERDDALGGITPAAGDWTHLFASANGALWVAIDGTVTVASHAVTNAGTFAVQEDGAALTALQIMDDWDESDRAKVNLIVGQAGIAAGAGAVGATVPRVTLASDDPGVALLTTIDADTSAIAGAISGTEIQADIVASLPAGDNNIGNVDLASAIPAGTNNIGDVDIASVQAATSGGCDIFRSIDLDESEEEVKATAGQLYGGIAINLSSSVRYLKFYNATAANVTVGTTTPVLTIPIPTPGSANGAGFTLPIPAQGVAFSTAITVAATTALADNDTGAPGANEVVLNLFYK
jgi:hypothetical protein